MRPAIERPGSGSGDGPYDGASAARVYRVVRALPSGRVTTYGAIARLLGLSARYVGGAMARAPEGVSWWRVVGAGGAILTARLMDGTGQEQTALLLSEGIGFDDAGRVRLEDHGIDLDEIDPEALSGSERS